MGYNYGDARANNFINGDDLVELLNSEVVEESDSALKVQVETTEKHDASSILIWVPKSQADSERNIAGEIVGNIYIKRWFLNQKQQELNVEFLVNDYP